MASAAVQYPPSNQVLSGSYPLRSAPLPKPQVSDAGSHKDDKELAYAIAAEWLMKLRTYFTAQSVPLEDLFLEESSWRDLLCMSWDFRTLQNPREISTFCKKVDEDVRIVDITLDTSVEHRKPHWDELGEITVVRAFLIVKTTMGNGCGVVRLVKGQGTGSKATTFFTMLQEITGHEEHVGIRRPTGLDREADLAGMNWADRRKAQQNFEGERQPVVLIIGAGQGGLSIAARLKQLGVEALIIDRNPRIGDNWRNRYHQLVLHDSVWYDHMPYLQFPPNWPTFTPKDKLADWFEYYAGIMELNVWTSTNIQDSTWSDQSRSWSITVEREHLGTKEKRALRPRHVILATGHSGEPYLPSNISGLDTFRGDRLVHSSQFTEPSSIPEGSNKKAVVVGCCNSGHDIARDYYDHGYDVTMVQRSSTLVLTSETLIDVTMKGLYSEDGPPVEDADIINMSKPNPLIKTLGVADMNTMLNRDSTLLSGLTHTGFAVDSGPDCSGLFIKYLSRGGGYYIDVGCSQLIADGKIKVKQGQEIKAVKEHGMEMADGQILEADEIVFATGYQNMRESARKIFGDELAERVGDVWGFDQEGETRCMWRRSGHPGFWFFGGNLALCRFYSRLLALQIQAVELGLMKV